MEYRLGNSKKIHSQGETAPLVCPHCQNSVNMAVFTNSDSRLIAELPLIKTGKVYFLVCPSCSSVFGVDEAKGKTFKKGEKLAIGNFDLKELQEFRVL